MPAHQINPRDAVQLGGPVIQRIDVKLLTATGEVEISAFRDPTGFIPVDLEGPAERAAKVRVASTIAGAHLRRVEELSGATMEMLDYVMGTVLVDGSPIAGPDGKPLLSPGFVEAYQQLVEVRKGKAGDDDDQPEDAAPAPD